MGTFVSSLKISIPILAIVAFVLAYSSNARLNKLESAITCVQQPKDRHSTDSISYLRGYNDGLTWCKNALTGSGN